jgi:hypothetical protein
MREAMDLGLRLWGKNGRGENEIVGFFFFFFFFWEWGGVCRLGMKVGNFWNREGPFRPVALAGVCAEWFL